MMPLFRQERCTPRAPIQCHADFTSRERQHHLAQHDNQVEELIQPEEECEASDKNDWQIDMPDGDEIDDVEKASVDDDSPFPRNRQRLRF